MDENNSDLILKAEKLAQAIRNSEEFKEQDFVAIQNILTECNKEISELIQVDYAMACLANTE
ncbi:MAG: hypothetical protein ACLFP2_01850 [Candidatus Woesearchaeota archaeon]